MKHVYSIEDYSFTGDVDNYYFNILMNVIL